MASKNDPQEIPGLFDLDESSASYLNEKKRSDDGLYRPSLDKIRGDKRRGYQALVRILPNLTKEGKIGSTALEKHIHYADFQDHPDLSGYYDCKKNFEANCELCTMFWTLKKSKNAADVEKAQLISRTTKYYSYVLVIEDENQPELVGKVLVWQYGFKIKEKIKAEFEGRRACRVEDLSAGMDLELVIKEVSGYTNYDSSKFTDQGPIYLPTEERKLRIDPTTGKITREDQAIVIELLKNRQVDLDNYKATPWTDEVQDKVTKIIAVLSGNYVSGGASDVTYGNSRQSLSADDVLGGNDVATQRPAARATASTSDVFDEDFLDGLDAV